MKDEKPTRLKLALKKWGFGSKEAAAKFAANNKATSIPVSYTHLRAHETDSYLVCRLLLEKKK